MSKAGHEGKAYLNTGTVASPTQVEMKRVKDLSTPLTRGEVDVSRRECDWELLIQALIKGGVEFGYQYKSGGDTIFAALVDSFLNKTPLIVSAMDGDITVSGAFGFFASFLVFDISKTEGLQDGQITQVVLKPTDAEEGGSLIEPDLILIA